MSNIFGTVCSLVTASFGVSQMKNHDFTPVTFIFFIIGILVLCFLTGLLGEAIESKFYKKVKDRWHGIGQ